MTAAYRGRKPVAADPPKPARGRPYLGTAGLRRVLSIKISDEIYSQWSAAARRQDQTIGEWIREAGELAIAHGSTR